MAVIPIGLFFAINALWHFVFVTINWRGHAHQMLLLRLLDAQQNQPINGPDKM